MRIDQTSALGAPLSVNNLPAITKPVLPVECQQEALSYVDIYFSTGMIKIPSTTIDGIAKKIQEENGKDLASWETEEEWEAAPWVVSMKDAREVVCRLYAAHMHGLEHLECSDLSRLDSIYSVNSMIAKILEEVKSGDNHHEYEAFEAAFPSGSQMPYFAPLLLKVAQ